MHQNLHDLGFKVPGLTLFFYGVDLRLDQPIIDAKIPLHQLYLTECTNFSTYRHNRTLLAFPPNALSNVRSLSANRRRLYPPQDLKLTTIFVRPAFTAMFPWIWRPPRRFLDETSVKPQASKTLFKDRY